jgi:poly-beta-1,6-N-acetyl-D-glucosamine biosynthesis protein PgaD
MSNTLIINARQQMPWQQRLASDTSTAVLWGWWLWLCRPALSAVNWLATLGAGVSPSLTKLMIFGSSATLEAPMAALLGTSSTLMLWNMLPTQATPTAQVRTIHDYASHFGLAEEQILSGLSSSVCVVHHGENGQITGIECRA